MSVSEAGATRRLLGPWPAPRRRPWLALLVTALMAAVPPAAPAEDDPFSFFRPTVTLTPGERRQLARNEPIARTLPAEDREITVFSAIPVAAGPDRVVAWARRVDAFKRNAYVLQIRPFSNPPSLDDLAALTLDSGDLDDVRRCRPGSCELKLAAAEMEVLQRAANLAGRDWRAAVNAAFREVVLDRIQTYLRGGHAALAPQDDRHPTVWPGEHFETLVGRTAFLTRGLPRFADALVGPPDPASSDVESLVYWSKEVVGSKPVVAATHMRILRHDDGVRPEVLVAGAGIFATHYSTASLGVTALVGARTGQRYLVYINRTEVDVLDGLFGGVTRRVLERRFRSEAAAVLRDLRARLESGDPI